MEILSQSTNWWIYIPIIALSIGGALFFSIGLIYGLYCTIKEGSGDGNLVAVLIMFVFTALFVTFALVGIHDGPTTTYKAIVTDYNVIYEEGYEIISTEGKIVTLTKE